MLLWYQSLKYQIRIRNWLANYSVKIRDIDIGYWLDWKYIVKYILVNMYTDSKIG